MNIIDIHLHYYGPMLEEGGVNRYLNWMDKHDVECGLVHGIEAEGFTNDEVLKLIKAHPDRFYGSCCADLTQPIAKPIETIKHFHGEGFKCVKLFPNHGFDPNDEKFEPVWNTIEECGMFVLSHCGWLGATLGSKERVSCLTATPFHFEIPARLHPKINFIFAHFGGGASYLETVTLISRLPNCFADTCPGWGKWVFDQNMPGLGGLPMDKVLYGTDNKWEEEGYRVDLRYWESKFTSMGVNREGIENYFYNNAAKILGI